MDDEDFNSELLGAAQRQQNLKQNEATREEIAALRADLKRKEAEEKAAPKCPYCLGAITTGAVKCRHCTSDIKWCGVRGKNYPIKTDEDPVAFSASKESEFQAAAERKAAEQKRIRGAQKRAIEAQLQTDKENHIALLVVLVAVVASLLVFKFCSF